MASKLSALGIAAAAILAGCTEEKAEAEPVEVEELVVAQEDEGIKLDIKVPQVEGLEAFNEQAMRLGEQLEEQTRQSEQAVEEGYTDLHAEGKMNFETKFLDAQTISVLTTGFLYEAGAVNGYTYKEALNYDLQTGSAIELADLFNGQGYEAGLLEAVESGIAASNLEGETLDTLTEIKVTQQFYLTGESLVLVFDQYEITSGAQIPPELAIAKNGLENLKEVYK